MKLLSSYNKASSQHHKKLHILSNLMLVDGFTLIELLVTIIIIGVLSSIALPSFLNQVSKASASEAKSSTGAILRAQQAYRYQTGRFSDQVSNLDISVQQEKYNYVIQSNLTTNFMEMRAIPNSNQDLHSYAGAVLVEADTNFKSIICESNDNAAAGGVADVVTAGLTCSSTSHQIE